MDATIKCDPYLIGCEREAGVEFRGRMFRIRQVYDASSAANAETVGQVRSILKAWFPDTNPSVFDAIPDELTGPWRRGFRTLLYVAEDGQGRVKGCALVLTAKALGLAFLDYLAAAPRRAGSGVGGALYQRVREDCIGGGLEGLFLECAPDDPAFCRDPATLRVNVERLRFYEGFGARPIIGTAFETPFKVGVDEPLYLVFDSLGREGLPRRAKARAFVRAMLKRKYGHIAPPGYILRVVRSFQDDPVKLRLPRYRLRTTMSTTSTAPAQQTRGRAALIVNEEHEIHHVRERGYVQAPVRVRVILDEVARTDLFEQIEPRRFPDSWLYAVHDRILVDYIRNACVAVEPGRSIYPHTFPVRNRARPPKELPLRAGYFCIDTATPLNRNAYLAARRAVDCALSAAHEVLDGRSAAYALVRPPGHHAERRVFGGFCYFNNAAIAAHYLSRYGRVAVLDIDYHHGNGTQDIFYARGDVLTVSIHGHPRFAYPYFSGFADERGEGAGRGFNLNIPLPELLEPEHYHRALALALRRVARFRPHYLVLSVGFDTAKGDPTGTWSNTTSDFFRIGRAIGLAGYPTLVVQEGGYRTRTLGRNTRRFFEGLLAGITDRSPGGRRRLSTGAVDKISLPS